MGKIVLILVFLGVITGQIVFAQRTVRILVLNHSANPPKSEKGVTITPLTGGGNTGNTNDAGLFDIKLSTAKPGDRLDLIVNKTDYQILGPDPRIFNYAVPNDANEYVRIAIIKASDFNAIKADFEAAIEKRIKQATTKLDVVIDSLQKAVNDDVRSALAKTIAEQNNQINDLRKNKEELATRLAQVDLEEASEFARLALKKFKEDGDVKAALAMMPEDKLDAFWDNVLLQEEKVKKAKAQGVENYIIRARLLVADLQFNLAYQNYLEAIQRDSSNINNLWEAANYLSKQRQDQLAIKIFEKMSKMVNTETDRISILNELGNLYRKIQKMAEAEKAYLEALSIYRNLATQAPDAFLSDLARTLNNLGNYYRENQKMADAEEAFLEALDIYRNIATKNPDTFLPNLASVLTNLGIYYRGNQKNREAEKALLEALDIRRKLAIKKPDVFLSDLAGSLNNLGNYYRGILKMLEAEKAYLEALDIFRKLAAKNPDAFLQGLARTLNNLGLCYIDNQKMAEAEKTYLEALDIRRNLAAKNPDAFLPDLAGILNNLGDYYRSNQKMPEAEKVLIEARDIRRKMVAKNPNAFLLDLARTLNNLGNYYRENQKMPEAEEAFIEALVIYRNLVAKSPDAFLPDLAITLNNLGALYSVNQNMPTAEKVYLEVLDSYRNLANKNPNTFLPNLASALRNLGFIYATQRRFDSAKKVYSEALSIYLEIVLAKKTQFAKNLRQTIQNIGDVRDSLSVRKEYVQIIEIDQTLASTLEALAPVDSNYAQNAARELGRLAWHNLFVSNYPQAQAAAEKGLRLDPNQTWINTNLALSILYQGQFQNAQSIYQKLKDQPYDDQGKIYRDVFLSDLEILEKEGITHPDVKKVRKLLQKK